MKIYLPSEYVDSPCKVINNGYIRVYTDNNLRQYVDVYVNQDYMLKNGESNYSYNGVCDYTNVYTDNIYYRLDIDKILISFLVISLVIISFVLPLFKRFLHGRRFNKW